MMFTCTSHFLTSFVTMQTEQLTKFRTTSEADGEVGRLLNRFKPPSNSLYNDGSKAVLLICLSEFACFCVSFCTVVTFCVST